MEETKTAEEIKPDCHFHDESGKWMWAYSEKLFTQQQSANAELRKQNEAATKFIQMHLDSLDLSNLDFYNKYGFNVAETFPRTREFISKHTT